VGSDAVGLDILILGRSDLNRAIDGDIVAVELLPESEWKKPGTRIGGPGGGGDKTAGAAGAKDGEGDTAEAEGVSLAPAVAEDVTGDAGASASTKPFRADSAVPTGRVVGIVRRSWRERGYAASIDLGPGSAGAAASAAAAAATTAASRASHLLAIPVGLHTTCHRVTFHRVTLQSKHRSMTPGSESATRESSEPIE
jgi:exosome complex exonuclease DIS3/RRP44